MHRESTDGRFGTVRSLRQVQSQSSLSAGTFTRADPHLCEHLPYPSPPAAFFPLSVYLYCVTSRSTFVLSL
jgi:hypothetical protein